MLHVQLCKQKSGTNTNRVTARYNNERKEVKKHKNTCVQMPVFKCYICKYPKWHKNSREMQDQEKSANIFKV